MRICIYFLIYLYLFLRFVLMTNFYMQVFLVRKIVGRDANTLYAMKVLKKATLKGNLLSFSVLMKLT